MGAALLPAIRDINARTILDFGCGKGRLKAVLASLAPDVAVHEFDPAIPGKETLPSIQPDLLVALDVMEHVEPDYLDAVLETMRDIAARVSILSISTVPAKKMLPDGRNAHILLQSHDWWIKKLSAYFTTLDTKVSGDHFVYIGASAV